MSAAPYNPLLAPLDPSPALSTLPIEILLMIVAELRFNNQICHTCGQVQAIWRSERNLLSFALTTRHFNDVMRNYNFVPRSGQGNTLLETFTCSCTLARIRAVAASSITQIAAVNEREANRLRDVAAASAAAMAAETVAAIDAAKAKRAAKAAVKAAALAMDGGQGRGRGGRGRASKMPGPPRRGRSGGL